MTQLMLEELARLQRKMLRRIIGWRRLPNESWRQTMTRMNQRLEHANQIYHCEEWSIKYFRNLWNSAHHLAYSPSSHGGRILTLKNKTIKVDPYAIFHPNRTVGRPKLRWDDLVSNFFRVTFPDFNEHWLHAFVRFDHIGLESQFLSYARSAN